MRYEQKVVMMGSCRLVECSHLAHWEKFEFPTLSNQQHFLPRLLPF